MAQYNDFLDEVNLVVPGVARPIVSPVLRRIISQFCEDSRIWSVSLGPYPANGEEEVNLAELALIELEFLEATLVDVLVVTLNGNTVDQKHYSRLARQGIRWNIPGPLSGELTFRVSLKPAPDCTELPDLLLDDWAGAVGQGVAWRLMMQPGKDWSDVKLAMYYKDEFERSINNARFEANNQRNGSRGGKKYNFW